MNKLNIFRKLTHLTPLATTLMLVLYSAGLFAGEDDHDHEEDEEKIRKQFVRLVTIAKKRGSAVGIGHPKKKTHRVLKEMLQNLKNYTKVLQ